MKIANCKSCHHFHSVVPKWTFCPCGCSAFRLLQDHQSVSVWGATKIFQLDDQDYMDYLYSGTGDIKITIVPESSPRFQRRKEKPEL